jgi:hypothetical protein
MLDNSLYANLVIASIIGAGLLVGIQTYPSMKNVRGINIADKVVQVTCNKSLEHAACPKLTKTFMTVHLYIRMLL